MDAAPRVHDTCSAGYHDSFSSVGSDGKRYPTWHPPEGEEQGRPCTFGHEHGRDPRGSALLADVEAQYGGLLFGYANEQLDEYNRAERISERMRHEDHVGHKIEWENDVQVFESVTNGGANQRALAVRCDFLMKVHQGTHSPDAFTNNLHELLYAAQCRDRGDGSVGTKLIAYTMVQFGDPGGFTEGGVAGGSAFVKVGPASPARSPAGMGQRSIPTDRPRAGRGAGAAGRAVGLLARSLRGLALGQLPASLERPRADWPTSTRTSRCSCRRASTGRPPRPARCGRRAPAGDVAAQVGRSVELCYSDDGPRRARGGECDRAARRAARVAWDDPRSPFEGVKREFYFNQTTIVQRRQPDHAGTPTPSAVTPASGPFPAPSSSSSLPLTTASATTPA